MSIAFDKVLTHCFITHFIEIGVLLFCFLFFPTKVIRLSTVAASEVLAVMSPFLSFIVVVVLYWVSIKMGVMIGLLGLLIINYFPYPGYGTIL